MKELSPRRFTIADVMILVAAAALGCLLLRVYHANRPPFIPGYTPPFVWKYATEASPIVIVWPFALLAARAIPPRPTYRRIFRQPGTMACLAALLHLAFYEVTSYGKAYIHSFGFDVEYHFQLLLSAGYAVAIAWLAMSLVGAWRPEASWVDRAGRALGAYFITIYILTSVHL